MSNVIARFSPVSALVALNCFLAVCYIGLVASSLSYATLEVQFSQSVKNDEASVATLDTQYLAALEAVTASNYVALGYAKPVAESFVPGAPETAVNFH